MSRSKDETFEVSCPCCGARLTIDKALGKVLFHGRAGRRPHDRDLDHATDLLAQDAARRDSQFRESLAGEKSKPELLERKFQEAMKRSKKQPLSRPPRDFDLD
jgi:hypothetical protein